MPTKKTAPPPDEEGPAIPPAAIDLHRIKRSTTVVRIEGISPLIAHRWTEKARRQMLDKQRGVPVDKKAPKDPEADFDACRYKLPDGTDGFPVVAFKAAIVNAVSLFENVTKVLAKQSIFVAGHHEAPDLVPLLLKDAPVMREDSVRISGTADLRYRPEYWPWSADLHITYIDNVFTPEAVLALVDAAGLGGVGEWRPSAPRSYTGTYGRFEVAAS